MSGNVFGFILIVVGIYQRAVWCRVAAFLHSCATRSFHRNYAAMEFPELWVTLECRSTVSLLQIALRKLYWFELVLGYFQWIDMLFCSHHYSVNSCHFRLTNVTVRFHYPSYHYYHPSPSHCNMFAGLRRRQILQLTRQRHALAETTGRPQTRLGTAWEVTWCQWRCKPRHQMRCKLKVSLHKHIYVMH